MKTKISISIVCLLCSVFCLLPGCVRISWQQAEIWTLFKDIEYDTIIAEPNRIVITDYASVVNITPELIELLSQTVTADQPASAADESRTSFSSVSGSDELVFTFKRVYDGDTLFVDITHWPAFLGEDFGIRINGIDTPEMRGKSDREKQLARQAKHLVQDMLQSASVIRLENVKWGKYSRLVADVYADGVSVADRLIEKGLAVPYDGGTKTKDWSAPEGSGL